MDTPRQRAVDPVGLGSWFVADEHRAVAAVIEFPQVWCVDLHVGYAAECPQVLDQRCVPVPELVGGAPSDGLAGRPVQQIYRRRHRLPPDHTRERLGLHHIPGHAHHGLVVALDDAVLLGCVRRRELHANVELGTVVDEVGGVEFPATVGVQHQQLLAALAFRRGLNVLDGGDGGVFGRQQGNPHET